MNFIIGWKLLDNSNPFMNIYEPIITHIHALNMSQPAIHIYGLRMFHVITKTVHSQLKDNTHRLA